MNNQKIQHVNIHDLSNHIYEGLINVGQIPPLPSIIYNKIKYVWDCLCDELQQNIVFCQEYFEDYIIYYINTIGITDFINGNASFGKIGVESNKIHAQMIKDKMIEDGIEIECRCGQGISHTYSMIKGTEGLCNHGTYVKLVYDGCIIKYLGFINHEGAFLQGQCYARRLLLIRQENHYEVEPFEDQYYFWHEIANVPTCLYNPLQREWFGLNNAFNEAGPSHEEMGVIY
jgi:hypothetical protein